MANVKINGNLNAENFTQSGVNIFDKIYPVGSIYISVNNTNPQVLFGVDEWSILPAGRTLWSTKSNDAGTPVSAGLPNVIGNFNAYTYNDGGPSNAFTSSMGREKAVSSGATAGYNWVFFNFNANAGATVKGIYGNSDTVQPPAIKVYMWKRTS